MSSVCITNCLNDTVCCDPRIPVRATYVNLYKWPESDADFVRSVTAQGRDQHPYRAKVVDSISCRQMYLRSYPFSKEEDHVSKTKCFGGERKRGDNKETTRGRTRGNKRCTMLRRVRELSWSTVSRIFHRLLSCSASVDIVESKLKEGRN
ncbi:uncharacterized protein LOC104436140 [Eucalyptus grandis]|uniref:uncharacterized protein LOC104436140 n=1 Tax=Eucalyptus grandis TaxID=71139 RepID=UPI00192E9D98|nr:uncharacterized protein LOC104436140 [Eucalyptus grandis]